MMTLPEQQYLQQVLRSGEEIRWQAVPEVEHVATLIQELCKNDDDAR